MNSVKRQFDLFSIKTRLVMERIVGLSEWTVPGDIGILRRK